MKWYAVIFCKDLELKSDCPLRAVQEAKNILAESLYWWLQPPFWTADYSTYCCHKDENSGKGHGDGPKTADVVTLTTGRVPFRLAKGFHMLHVSER